MIILYGIEHVSIKNFQYNFISTKDQTFTKKSYNEVLNK